MITVWIFYSARFRLFTEFYDKFRRFPKTVKINTKNFPLNTSNFWTLVKARRGYDFHLSSMILQSEKKKLNKNFKKCETTIN